MIRHAPRVALGIAALACLGAPAPSSPVPARFRMTHVDEIRSANPLQEGEASSAQEILRGQGISAHLIQISGRIRPHIHRNHEETAYVLEGSGVFVVGETAHPVKAGDLMIVPRGLVHSYQAREPTTVLAFYDPPFDPADRIFVDQLPTSP